MGEYIKARFVGGPRHNEVIECARLPCIRAIERVNQQSLAAAIASPNALLDPDVSFRTTEYRLFRFVSEGGSKWAQYVHESQIENGDPRRSTYAEAELPKMPVDDELEFHGRLLAAWMRSIR
jgi:hypothetical protein